MGRPPDARPHRVTGLGDRLRREIAARGPMSVARFMAIALDDPQHGYYRTRDPLGRAGDFTTAPEISQIFGELIGIWLVDCWDRLGRPEPFQLVELGPGRGTLTVDALRAARIVPAFAAAAALHLVETSPVLRARQKATLEAADAPAPAWHESLATVPEGPLLLVANEFFDALPIRQFQRAADGWHERMVGCEDGPGGALCFTLAPRPSPAATLLPAARADCPIGAVVEYGEAAESVAAEIGRRIARTGGGALIADYGHSRPGVGDTLQAVRRHRYADPLADPGETDLTAHVDFSALAAAARESGAAVDGPVAQARWLDAMGIAARAAALKQRATPDQCRDIDSGVERLTAADGMGHLFQMMSIAPQRLAPTAGFGSESRGPTR
ncbi:MAG: class I SAM-dependent methyltransferase [Inquilinus sp.]|nr:class I SAM-dependent methyltransferase [Inquilinus sp.]